MHGRLKVKTTEQQKLEKKIAQGKKLKAFQHANGAFIAKLNSKTFDDEGMAICTQILAVNPDYNTMWNYRKQYFDIVGATLPHDEFQSKLTAELSFIQSCLQNNPKSYGSWHQRCYVTLKMGPDCNWKRELDLCNQFLQVRFYWGFSM